MRPVLAQGYDAAAYAAAGYGSQAEYEAAAAAYGMSPYGDAGGAQAAGGAGGWGAQQLQAQGGLHGAADQKLGAPAAYGASAEQASAGPPLPRGPATVFPTASGCAARCSLWVLPYIEHRAPRVRPCASPTRLCGCSPPQMVPYSGRRW